MASRTSENVALVNNQEIHLDSEVQIMASPSIVSCCPLGPGLTPSML